MACVCIVPHLDEAGALVRYDGLVEDVTERRRAEERFQRLLESAPDAMVIVDAQGRIVLANTQAENLFGYSREELLGRAVEVLVPEHVRERHVQRREAFCSSVRSVVAPQRFEFPAVHKDGSQFPATISLSLVETETGALVSATIRDLSEQQAMQQELLTNYRIQAAIGSLLRISLRPISLREQFEQMLDTLFTVDWVGLESKGAIFVAEEGSGTLVLTAHRGISPEQLKACSRVKCGQCLCGQAAAKRDIVFADCVDERHTTRYAGMHPHGHYCVPVCSDESVLGVVNLYVKHGHEPRDDERQFLTAIADVVAGTIRRQRAEEKQKRVEIQLVAAQRIQEHLLPFRSPSVPGFDIAGACFPAEFVGGDYFDYLHLPDGSLGIAIGDVSGHGIDSALLTASTCAHVRSFAETHSSVEEILSHTNSALCKEAEGGHFVTFLFAHIDPRSRVLQFANAGHPCGYVLGQSDGVKTVLESGSLPLAVHTDSGFSVGGDVRLESGDILVLLTDGVLEARSPVDGLFGADRALEIVHANRAFPAQEIIRNLYEAMCDFAKQSQLLDDVTVVVIKVS